MNIGTHSIAVKFDGQSEDQRFLGTKATPEAKLLKVLMAHRRFAEPAELFRALLREDYDYRVRAVQILSPNGRQSKV